MQLYFVIYFDYWKHIQFFYILIALHELLIELQFRRFKKICRCCMDFTSIHVDHPRIHGR